MQRYFHATLRFTLYFFSTLPGDSVRQVCTLLVVLRDFLHTSFAFRRSKPRELLFGCLPLSLELLFETRNESGAMRESPVTHLKTDLAEYLPPFQSDSRRPSL